MEGVAFVIALLAVCVALGLWASYGDLVKRLEAVEGKPAEDKALRDALDRMGLISNCGPFGVYSRAAHFLFGARLTAEGAVASLAAALGYELRTTPASPEKSEWVKLPAEVKLTAKMSHTKKRGKK